MSKDKFAAYQLYGIGIAGLVISSLTDEWPKYAFFICVLILSFGSYLLSKEETK